MASRQRHGGSRSRHYSNPCRIFVGNISYRIKEPELKDFFSEFGNVTSCEVVRDHIKGWSRGIGFVTFKEAESAQMALSAHEDKLTLDDRVMRTSVPTKPKRQKAKQDVNEGEATELGAEVTELDAEMAELDAEVDENSDTKEKEQPSSEFSERIAQLPDDVLHVVVSFLDLKDRIRVERVCKQWQRVARQWWKSAKTLHFYNTFKRFKHALTDDILHSILKRGCHELRSLDLSASPSLLTNFSLELIAMYCPNLERVDLSGINATQTSFKQFSTSCLRLKSLKACGAHYIGEKCLWWVMHNCTQLECLDLSKNKRISGQCFYVAGEKLHTVVLSDTSITDAGLILLTQHSSNLRCLNISLCDHLSSGAIHSVAENCHQLTELYLNGPSINVKTTGLMTLGRLQELEVLKINKQIACKDSVLSAVARGCQKLRVLSCEACYDITDEGLMSLVACEHLSHLTISYCHNITDEGLMRLSAKGKLEHLKAKACQWLTDSALCCLAENCLQLKELDISGCMYVTNKTLYAFQESLLHMRTCFDEEFKPRQFSIVLGGTNVDGAVARQFSTDTGASLSLHDLSVRNLSANYGHFIDLSEECWDDDDEVAYLATAGQLDSKSEFKEKEAELMVGDHGSSYYAEKAEDFLLADDPALFSDEFSDPEDWGVGFDHDTS